ncbi:pyrophosphohydrolase domain-containing protein [Streptosporangium sandarakinum]
MNDSRVHFHGLFPEEPYRSLILTGTPETTPGPDGTVRFTMAVEEPTSRPAPHYGYYPMDSVAAWHEAIGQKPYVSLSAEERVAALKLRLALITEEFEEVKAELEAGIAQDGNLAHLAKELADLLYVTYGTADLLDIPLDDVFDLVHANNMTKVDPETGKVKRRKDGKIEPPDGFTKLTDDEIGAVITRA